MQKYFARIKDRITSEIKRFIARKRPELARINPLGPDLCDRLQSFVLQGKMIRGCLVPLGYALSRAGDSRGDAPQCVDQAGAAMELFQSGLLVHDDIMDRDLTRRGSATIFQQYAEKASREGRADHPHLGESLGICAGDIAYFLAYEMLAGMETDPPILRNIFSLCSRELTAVGVAQMQDVSWGSSDEQVREEDILRLYTYKTGRYTFSLPLMAGGLLAGAEAGILSRMEQIGEDLGVLFQIKDDELGLFGDESELGKPVGSDVREGKKTLHYSLLMARASSEERGRLAGIFGNRASSEKEIRCVRDMAIAHGIQALVDEKTREPEARARALIRDLPHGAEEDRKAMFFLLDFTLSRTR